MDKSRVGSMPINSTQIVKSDSSSVVDEESQILSARCSRSSMLPSFHVDHLTDATNQDRPIILRRPDRMNLKTSCVQLIFISPAGFVSHDLALKTRSGNEPEKRAFIFSSCFSSIVFEFFCSPKTGKQQHTTNSERIPARRILSGSSECLARSTCVRF